MPRGKRRRGSAFGSNRPVSCCDTKTTFKETDSQLTHKDEPSMSHLALRSLWCVLNHSFNPCSAAKLLHVSHDFLEKHSTHYFSFENAKPLPPRSGQFQTCSLPEQTHYSQEIESLDHSFVTSSLTGLFFFFSPLRLIVNSGRGDVIWPFWWLILETWQLQRSWVAIIAVVFLCLCLRVQVHRCVFFQPQVTIGIAPPEALIIFIWRQLCCFQGVCSV